MNNIPVVAAVFEFDFMAGSMGSVVGERFVRGVQEAIRRKCAFVCFYCKPGCPYAGRFVLSLMQMVKTTDMIARLSNEKLPFISVLTDPTMGGVSAKFCFHG